MDDPMRRPEGHCWCRRCEDAWLRRPENLRHILVGRRFIVCPDCGNKRCPRATQHDNACTRSNASGQPGSDYE